MLIGYHASHEQFPPGRLLAAVQRAETVGFDAAMCSDHLAPWGLRQGHSGFAWGWLGAALATTRLPFGLVTAPGQRYHPVVLAQAIATLAEMFPGRLRPAFGSGEALNEHVTGERWPAKPERERRLARSVAVIRRLLDGERVDERGAVRVHEARVWSRPDAPPPLRAAAVTPRTAAWAASWADGLVTVGPQRRHPSEVLAAYREAGGRGRAALQLHLSLGEELDSARRTAREQWRHCAVPADRMWDLEQPEDFDAFPVPDDEALDAAVLVDERADSLAERIAGLAEGFDEVHLHHVGLDQEAFLRRAGDELLPAIRERA